MHARPRLYRNGMREDAASYAGISCWDGEGKAKREAKIANEALVQAGRAARWTHVVRLNADGHRLHVWADDLGPDRHFTVWGEPEHLASTAGEPIPISDAGQYHP